MRMAAQRWGLFWLLFMLGARCPGMAQGLDLIEVSQREGLTFNGGVSLYVGSSSDFGRIQYIASMGASYCLTPRLECGIRIYYGGMTISQNKTRPVSGQSEFAGGGMEGKFFFGREGPWTPFVAAGYDLFSALEYPGVGYEGSGVHASLGVEHVLSRFFCASFEGTYWNARFHELNGFEGQAQPLFVPFTNHLFSFSLSIQFYPSAPETTPGF